MASACFYPTFLSTTILMFKLHSEVGYNPSGLLLDVKMVFVSFVIFHKEPPSGCYTYILTYICRVWLEVLEQCAQPAESLWTNFWSISNCSISS